MSAERNPSGVPTYAAAVKCGNCGNVAMASVPKGITVGEYTTTVKCTSCGCATLRPMWGREV